MIANSVAIKTACQLHTATGIVNFSDLSVKGVTLTAEELKNIQKEFGRGSYIKYKDFSKAFKAGSSLNRYSNSSKDNGDLTEILDTIRRKILDYYGSDVQALRRTKETFIDLDKDDTNRVSKKDFIKALDLLHVELRTREVDMLVEKYDKYRDFIDAIGFKK
jgi:Ca2+-binding EF-hand superfamily protein